MNSLFSSLFIPNPLCAFVSLCEPSPDMDIGSVYSVVPYPLKFSTADGSQKWEFLEAENWPIFYGPGDFLALYRNAC